MKKIDNVILGISVCLALIAAFYYSFYGYHPVVVLFWLGSLLLAAIGFACPRDTAARPFLTRYDIYLPIALVAIFAPLYLLFINHYPDTVTPDEVMNMAIEKNLIAQSPQDIVGLTFGNQFPTLPFKIFVWMEHIMGGISPSHMRIVHGFLAIAVILTSYFFFRMGLALTPLAASGATALLASNHAHIGYSRFALWDNTALLTETLALALLLWGLKQRSLFYVFLGGAAAGFSFYAYTPGRITIVLWFLFVGFMALFSKSAYSSKTLLKIGIVSMVGFLMAALPTLIAIIKSYPHSIAHQQSRILLFPEGRAEQQRVMQAGTIWENLIPGFTAFNSKIHDRSGMYLNEGHGFLDPLSGILLWIGIVGILWNKQKRTEDIFTALSFLFLWILLSTLITPNPAYAHLQIVLPLVAYLVIKALLFAPIVIENLLHRPIKPWIKHAFLGSCVALIVGWNLFIFGDFISQQKQQGLAKGDILREAMNIIESRSPSPNHTFYLVASAQYPYCIWGIPQHWRDWLQSSASETQRVEYIPSESIATFAPERPSTIFIPQALRNQLNKTLDGQNIKIVRDSNLSGAFVSLDIR